MLHSPTSFHGAACHPPPDGASISHVTHPTSVFVSGGPAAHETVIAIGQCFERSAIGFLLRVRFRLLANPQMEWIDVFLPLSEDPTAVSPFGKRFIPICHPATQVSGSADNYLHEAALADTPPSGTVYDPSRGRRGRGEGDGRIL